MSRKVRAPEPWREVPPEPAPRRAQNPHILEREQTLRQQETELGFGGGLVAPHLNGAPPSEGGIYLGRTPRVDPPPSGIGAPRQHRRRRNEVRGYPGDRVVR